MSVWTQLPTPVSESTAIEIVRKEGATFSQKSVSTITAGDILYNLNNSGLVQVIGNIQGEACAGVALYDAVSGTVATTVRGHLRCRWDGTGTVNRGTVIGSSATRSGWFEPSALASGNLVLGHSIANLAAANSGTLVEVFIE